ncbi:flagellar biosynthesis protein FliR [Phaeobacter sp. CECT 5382]|uniref:flagellar biosynthetic protein FliR n=1 Tax=Rhodobacterales TaxID=204455 RepID=UPI0006DB9F41|nr:flagellar biosynthetic protein FliR [Phaeobacter sp. CECT 5382]CUH86610.1 flagellar biosynthesis protein FliR [Phaeobacter sp. CECT 5382]
MTLLPLPPELLALLGASFWHFAIVFLRVAAMSALLPAFGEQYVPMHVKLGIAVAFTFIVAPALPQIPSPSNAMHFASYAASEAIIGAALGVTVRMFIMGLQTAGTIAAQSTSLSQVLGGIGAETLPAIGAVLMLAGLALAVMMGLHVRVAELLIYSYQIFPVGEFPEAAGFSKWGVHRFSQIFYMAFTLAAPFLITALIYNMTLGVINRAMPQLMVFFVGAPVITFGGLFILMVASPMILDVWLRAMMSFFADPGAGLR